MVGGLPAVRIAGWAGDRDGNHVANVTQIGPATSVQNYGQVYEISAIVGPGLRDGVDMVWGLPRHLRILVWISRGPRALWCALMISRSRIFSICSNAMP